MTKRDLEFICAFADVYELGNVPFMMVYKQICEWLEEYPAYYDCEVEDIIEDFMNHYDDMKKLYLDWEIKQCIKNGDTFFNACREWDI